MDLGAWTRDLIERVRYFTIWTSATNQQPVSTWLGAFTCPTGFLTRVLLVRKRRRVEFFSVAESRVFTWPPPHRHDRYVIFYFTGRIETFYRTHGRTRLGFHTRLDAVGRFNDAAGRTCCLFFSPFVNLNLQSFFFRIQHDVPFRKECTCAVCIWKVPVGTIKTRVCVNRYRWNWRLNYPSCIFYPWKAKEDSKVFAFTTNTAIRREKRQSRIKTVLFSDLYQSPVYYCPKRNEGTRDGGDSSVVVLNLKSGSERPDHWIKRATAVLLNLGS